MKLINNYSIYVNARKFTLEDHKHKKIPKSSNIRIVFDTSYVNALWTAYVSLVLKIQRIKKLFNFSRMIEFNGSPALDVKYFETRRESVFENSKLTLFFNYSWMLDFICTFAIDVNVLWFIPVNSVLRTQIFHYLFELLLNPNGSSCVIQEKSMVLFYFELHLHFLYV